MTGAHAAGPHTVRVLVKTAGDLATSDVEADLGGRFAFIEGVHRAGPVRRTDLVFAVDTSGSMAGAPIAAATAAGRRLLDAVGSTGRVGLVTFSDTASVVRPLTADTGSVRAALGGLDTDSGTALYDGIALAANTALAGSDPDARRIVVVLSDGADTASSSTLAAPHPAAARVAGVEVDAVGPRILALVPGGAASPDHLGDRRGARPDAHAGRPRTDRTPALAGPAGDDLCGRRQPAPVRRPDAPRPRARRQCRGSAAAQGVSGASPSFWSAYGESGRHPPRRRRGRDAGYVIAAAAGARGPRSRPRLADYTAQGAAGEPPGALALHARALRALEARLGETWAGSASTGCAARPGIQRPTGHVALAAAGSGLAGGLAATAVLGLLAGVAGLIAGLAAPVAALRFRAGRRQRQFEAELPELLSVWASALRAGRSFAQALDSIVDEAGEPAHTEFRRAQQQVRLGVPVEQALDEMSQRLRSESFELVVLTTDVQRRVGGNVAEIFDQVADTVRRRHQFSARVKALTSMGRLSAQVLIGMPFAMAGLLTLDQPRVHAPLYTTRMGHILIAVGLAMMTAGALILRRLVKPRVIA